MQNLQIPNLDYIRQKDPRFAEALDAIRTALGNVAEQTGSAVQGPQQTPASPTTLSVTASGGIFDITIADNNPANSGLAPDYFLEYSLTASFSQPHVIHLGPARTYRANLGNQTFYWRCYSQVGRASQPSGFAYFGPSSAPTPVAGGGATSGPTPLPSTGSGTAPTSGLTGGAGYGTLPTRSPQRPILP